jgi:hypothetical protein
VSLPYLYDRVKESTDTTGTGAVNLNGAYTGFQTFHSTVASGNECYYAIVGVSSEWEVGRGTFTGSALARTEVLDSSNAKAAVNFSAGSKDVFVTAPAINLERTFAHVHPFLLMGA